MTFRSVIVKIVQQEDVNFLLTNRIPRQLATRFMGWFSRIENPLISTLSLRAWQWFSDLDLSDATQSRFRSVHDCFVRQVEARRSAGRRRSHPFSVSPCDGIVGACGVIDGDQILQIKGFPYSLRELLGDDRQAASFRNGRYVTLRLTSSMYHHFHAPHDCRIESVTRISGDTWNVNPIALKRVEQLFCKNERAVVTTKLAATGHAVTLVAVAAILVAGVRLRFLDLPSARSEPGRRTYPCDAVLGKGEEIGWFEHGSTIIVLAAEGFALCDGVVEGVTIRVGQPLMRLPAPGTP